MGLIYDNPDLAALTLTRLAAEESEGPGALEGVLVTVLSRAAISVFAFCGAKARLHPRSLVHAVLGITSRGQTCVNLGYALTGRW